MQGKFSGFLAASVSVLALNASGQALAQTASATNSSSDGIEEVVVTARMRPELLKDVPVSVTAFSAQQLQDADVRGVSDFIGLTPNVSITQSESAGLNQVTIRGVTEVRNSDSPVAVVVDGVQEVDPRQFTQKLFDLQSVEVLRGPQGALYGRDALGGAIIINTKRPTDDLEGYLQGGVGTGNEYSAEGAISGPIVDDKLFFSVGASYTDRDGYFENIYLHRKQDPYRDFTGRGLLSWNITDNFTADLRVVHSHTSGGALNFHYEPANLLPDGVTLNPADPFNTDPLDANKVDRKFISTNIGEDRREIDSYSLKLDYRFDFGTLTSVTAYDRISEFVAGDQVPYTAGLTIFGGALDGTQTQYTDVSAISQEVRLTSNSDQRFRWMIGGYYLDKTEFISTTTGDDIGQGITPVYRAPKFADPSNATLTFFGDDNKNKAYAFFANADYDITNQLQASVALRYDREHRTQDVSVFNTGGTPGAVNRANFDKFQPKFTLTYKPTDNVTTYASYGIGFRSGQFNQNGTAAAAALAGQPGLSDVVPEETAKSAEIGAKAELWDGRIALNGALYHTNLTNSQYFVFIGAVGAQVLVPIDKTTLQGGEFEAQARLGGGFDAFLGFGATDSKINRYAAVPGDKGNVAPYVPDTTFDAGLQWRHELTSWLDLFARADYQRLGRQYWDPENTTARDAVGLINVRFGLEDTANRWSLISSIDNLTDKKYNAEYVLGGFTEPANPRVWRLQLRYNF